MNALPSHSLCPLPHGVEIFELSPIPVLFQAAPTALNQIVLAVIRRIAKQLNRLANLVTKLHQPLQKLSANPAAFRSIINLELKQGGLGLLGHTQAFPPRLERSDAKVTGFTGTPKVDG